MQEERQVTREDAEAAMHQIELAIDSGAEQATVRVMGTEVRLDKAPDGGFTVRSPGEPDTARFYMPMTDPPPGYPSDLPFIPGESLILSQPHPDAVTLVWLAPRVPEKIFAYLDHQCVSARWAPNGQSDTTDTPALRRSYKKDGILRHLLCSEGIVSLIQTKAHD